MGMDRCFLLPPAPGKAHATCTHHLFPSQVTVLASTVQHPSSNTDLAKLRRFQGPCKRPSQPAASKFQGLLFIPAAFTPARQPSVTGLQSELASSCAVAAPFRPLALRRPTCSPVCSLIKAPRDTWALDAAVLSQPVGSSPGSHPSLSRWWVVARRAGSIGVGGEFRLRPLTDVWLHRPLGVLTDHSAHPEAPLPPGFSWFSSSLSDCSLSVLLRGPSSFSCA